jgi:arginyl-tRNA--protein-N-Asp/Glu arginylyltransferase
LQDKIKKLAYAKVVLTNEIYQEIGEQWITHPDMTLEKLCTIAMSDPLTERPDD